MKEHPILFNTDMVRAVLEERKTETRRVIKPQPFFVNGAWQIKHKTYTEENWCYEESEMLEFMQSICPYGQVGDRLWVRETWRYYDWTEDGYPWIEFKADDSNRFYEIGIPDEWADKLTDIWAELSEPSNYDIDNRAADRKWRPSIFMPRWASRITLEITEIKVERVQDMENDDCIAEGIHQYFVDCNEDGYWDVPAHWKNPDGKIIKRVHADSPVEAFCNLWDSINKKRGFGWDLNPWVWVVKFKVVE